VTVTITWYDIALRIALTLIGSAMIGINRGEHGHAAGLRTTMLVALAGALSMIEVNLLLGTGGKLGDSFVVMDPMRLPLGILTGMGFIGAGAILQRGKSISGVTTAATLWLVTVIGLCFGSGQIGLGCIAVVIAMFVLWTLKAVDRKWLQDNRATLCLRLGPPSAIFCVKRKQIVTQSNQLKKNRSLVQRFRWNFRNQDSQNGRELMQEVSIYVCGKRALRKRFQFMVSVGLEKHMRRELSKFENTDRFLSW